MAIIYSINYSDPTVDPDNKKQFTIMPGVMDLTTSLVLPGQAAALYGEHIAENFLHILENFASFDPPENATVGQLWYDSGIGMLRILTDITTSTGGVRSETWTIVGGPFISDTPPQSTGSLWFDISNVDPNEWQLKIYNAGVGGWISVAERYIKKTGDAITGSITAVDHHVGLTAPTGLTGFYPSTEVGPAMASAEDAAVVINTGGQGGHSFIVYNATDFDTANVDANKLFGVADTGEVSIFNGVLNLHSHKIVNVADGTNRPDGVNFGQLSDIKNSLQDQIDTKVNRSGDHMTGALTISTTGIGTGDGTPGSGPYAFIVNSTGNNSGGVLIDGGDIDGDKNGIEITNKYGPAGSTQSVFSVKSFTGNTKIAGDVVMDKTLSVGTTSTFTGSVLLRSISTMDVPVGSITDNKHLVTKEYFDTMMTRIPPGLIGYYAMTAPPAGWLRADGSQVSRTVYSALFAAIGTLYGSGNGSTTFHLPDLRAEFIRGLDNGRGVDSGRSLGSTQFSANLYHSHYGSTDYSGYHNHLITNRGDRAPMFPMSQEGNRVYGDEDYYPTVPSYTEAGGGHSHSVSISGDGGGESRPRNVAMLACIKA